MSILFQYTKRVLKANKGRTAVTIAGIVLSFALFTAVLAAVSSGLHFMINFILAESGDWYGVVYQCTDDDKEKLEAQKEVTGIVSIENQGIAKLEGALTDSKPYAFVGGVDKAFCEKMSISLTTGRMPESPEEILIPEHVENAGLRYKIGDQITLQLGERFSNDGIHIHHSIGLYCGIHESESIHVTEERTFKVVGFYKRPGFENVGNPAFTFLTVKNNSAPEDLYFKTKNISDTKSVIKDVFSDHLCDVHKELMKYTGNSNNSLKKVLFGVVSVLCVVIAFVSLLLIYNAFSISLGERTKQFGLLKSIGATKKQIRLTVFMETILLCLISVPLGLIIGCLGVWGVLTFLQPAFRVIQSESAAASPVDIVFYVEPVYLIAAALAGMATVMLAAFIPAWRANRLSPIESIRQTSDVRITSARSMRGSGLWGKLFGIAGTLAYKNAKRNKKPYRAIIFSLVTSLVLLLGGGGLVYYTEKFLDIMTQEYRYDIDLFYNTTLSDGECEEVQSYLDGVDTVDEYCMVEMREACMTCGKTDGFAYAGKLFAKNMLLEEGKDLFVTLLYVEDEPYKAYLEELGLDLNDYLYAKKPKALVFNTIKGLYVDEKGKDRYFGGELFQESADLASYMLWAPKRPEGSISYYLSNDTVGYYFASEDDMRKEIPKEEARVFFGFELGELIDEQDSPYWLGSEFVNTPTFILPMRAALINTEQVFADISTHFYLLTNDAASAERSVRAMKLETSVEKTFFCSNTRSQVNYNLAFIQILQVFMLCFVALLCLIAIANITNTVTTSVRLRTREYAMLKSIGISNKTMFQFSLIENLTYSLKALIIGCLLGVGVNYLTFQAVTEEFVFSFSLPAAYYAAGIAGTVLLMFFAVFYMRRQTRKGNVCEELRNEVL